MIKIFFERKNYNSSLHSKEGLQNKILLVEIFVDDILFTGHDDLCKSFYEEMRKEFEMSMLEKIKLFVVLQVYQIKDRIYIT